MKPYFDLGTAAFALAAAVFWFLSAAKKPPRMSTYWDEAPENDPFYVALKFGVRMNRIGALFAGLSALCAFGSYVSG